MIDLIPGSRIDNRDELADRLSMPRAQVARMGIAELVLEAYQRWGEDCPKYVLGDFAFVIKDGTRLFLARDPMGVCPLYIGHGDAGFVYGGDVHEVLGHPGVCAEMSPRAILTYLITGGFHDPELTLYQQVTKLPAAHSLTVTGSGSQRRRYWHPAETARFSGQSSAEYSAQLRELLADAVRVRLPAEGHIATHLSGGLDSSAIAALAASQLDDPARLEAWSWMRPPASAEEEGDPEWSLARAVADKWNIPLHFTSFGERDFLNILQRKPLLDNDSADLWYEFPVREQMRSRGIGIVLSGWGGDQFISNAGESAYLEGLLSRNALGTLADLAGLAKNSRRPARAVASLARHQLAAPLLDYVRWRLSRASFNGWGDDGLQLATPEFQQWARQFSETIDRLQPRLRVRGRQLQELASGTIYNRVEAWAASGARAGVSYRYPLLDQRIVEFALGLPPGQYCGAGKSRRLFRDSMQGYFPAQQREGVTKREPQRVQEAYDTMASALNRLLLKFPPAPNPWIDVAALQRAAAALPPPGAALTGEALTALLSVKRATILATLSVDLPHF